MSKPSKPRTNTYPPWAPRFWGGMRVPEYFGMLVRNRLNIHVSKYPMTFLVAGCSLFNSAFSLCQRLLYHKRIQQTELKQPPIFIVGHWRSGTTLMHELLALNESRTYPSNFHAFVPHHFLVSNWCLRPMINLLMPSKRPMDDMALSADAPQEDDFALISLGIPTPYFRIAFAKNRSQNQSQFDLSKTDPKVEEQIQNGLQYFFRALTFKTGKQIISKSPPHTGRIQHLAKWFPDAKFIHISRHPHKMVPSTIRLWQILEETQGFQSPNDFETIKRYVFKSKDQLYDAYFSQREELPKSNLVEIRFEDLVANPVSVIEQVHQQLELEGLDDLIPKVENYFEQKREHKTHKNPIDDSLRSEINHHWIRYMSEFGYDK